MPHFIGGGAAYRNSTNLHPVATQRPHHRATARWSPCKMEPLILTILFLFDLLSFSDSNCIIFLLVVCCEEPLVGVHVTCYSTHAGVTHLNFT